MWIRRGVSLWLLVLMGLSAAGCDRPTVGAPAGISTGRPTERLGVEAGPYDILELPLEEVPEPPAGAIFHPEFHDPGSGAFVQVLRVLDDPRHIPLERWLYSRLGDQDAVLHPDASWLRTRFKGEALAPMAVFVRVRAPLDSRVRDPFFFSETAGEDPATAWPPLEAVDPGSELGLPCAPLEYTTGRGAYTAPDTGERFDPLAYTPPRPWYDPVDPRLEAGETRQGWLLCLSAAPAQDARLKWRTRLEGAAVEGTTTAWSGMRSLPTGEWHLLPEMSVLAWNLEGEGEATIAGPEPPPGIAATPTSVIPAEGAEVVYQGPVWVSVGIGMSHRRETAQAAARPPLTADHAGSRIPGDCPGIGVWYQRQEPFDVVCRPAEEERFGRFFLQFAFPGMDALMPVWDRMALGERANLELFVQDDLDGLLATFQGVQIQPEFTWLRANLPDGTSTVWLAMTEVEGASGSGSLMVWEVELYDAAFGSSSTACICEARSCLDTADMVMASADRDLLRLEMSVPIMQLGESAHGITVRDAWTTDQTILINDNLHGQDFLPEKRSHPWLFVEIAAVTDMAGELYLLYPAGDGNYTVEPTELVALYRGSGGEIAVRFGVHAEVRGAEEGFALLGTLPRGVPLSDVLLVLARTGPAWRLQ